LTNASYAAVSTKIRNGFEIIVSMDPRPAEWPKGGDWLSMIAFWGYNHSQREGSHCERSSWRPSLYRYYMRVDAEVGTPGA
jgi:hypothetical protein